MQVIMKTRNALLAMTLLASPLSAATLYQGGSVIDVTSGQALDGAAVLAVSYTHLTLPTSVIV